MPGGAVELVDLSKSFGDMVAVDHIDLTIAPGEFFSLLGPSGCGKSTTLRLIAGFERPTSGRVLIDGVDMANTPPHQRPVNTVFQSYALFPHLDVGENVAFGLPYQNVSKAEAARRVSDSLEMVRLAGFERRKPHQLSGGQQQRVALARSLVLNPSVLLLDEPLGALDAKLRKALQVELKALQEEVGITFVYVTHDQDEALTMSDRLAVMSAGLIEQVGTPAEVYESPVSSYVADFLGLSNILPGVVIGPHSGGGCLVDVGGHRLVATSGATAAAGRVQVSIRPERVEIGGGSDDNSLAGTLTRTIYMGPTVAALVEVEGLGEVQVSMPNRSDGALERGAKVSLHFPPDALRVLELETP
jgi:spermidine/putrescine transport system ATP-binding protein